MEWVVCAALVVERPVVVAALRVVEVEWRVVVVVALRVVVPWSVVPELDLFVFISSSSRAW